MHSIRSIRNAERTYFQQYGRYGSLKELAELDLIARSLADGRSSGHIFELRLEYNNYHLTVIPEDLEQLRSKNNGEILTFYVDGTSLIRASVDRNKIADSSNDPIGKQD